MATTGEQDRDDGPAILPAVWRYKWMVVGVALLFGLVAFGVSLLQPVRYQAEASLILSDTPNASVFSDPQPQFGDPNRHVRNQAQRITSTQAAVEIAERLGFADVDEVRARLTAEPSDELDQITVLALGETPQRAVELADTAADVYEQLVTEEVTSTAASVTEELEAAAAQLEERIATLDAALQTNPDDAALVAERDAAVSQLVTVRNRAEQIAVDASLYGSGVEFYEPPELPESPVQPQLVRNTLAGLALGLLAAAALAWWRAGRAREEEQRDPAALLDAPLLGDVPDFSSVGEQGIVPTSSAPRSVAAEAYHFIAAAVEFELDELLGDRSEDARAVLVTSAGAADGKTTTALNLAIAVSHEGRRIRLVDGDGRMRGLSRLAAAQDSPGLFDLGDADGAYHVGWVEVAHLARVPLVPAGHAPADPAGFLRSPKFRRAMDVVKSHVDLVILDSPPLLAVSDTAAMTSEVDGIVLVVDRGTTDQALEEVRQRLEFASAPLLGFVRNRAETRLAAYGGYDYHDEPALQADGHGNAAVNGGRHARSRRGAFRRLRGTARSTR